MAWYLYRLTPPRTDFGATMSDEERGVMGHHVAYWSRHLDTGTALVFAPVADPTGDWGMAVVHADSELEVNALGDQDPAVVAGVGRYDVLLLPGAVVGPRHA